jgi:hypothetical protein
MRTKTKASLVHFTARFPPEVIEKWKEKIDMWNNNHDSADPYQDTQKGVYRLQRGKHCAYCC